MRTNWPRVTLLAGLGGCLIMVTYLMLYWDSNPPASLLRYQDDPQHIDLYAEQVHGVKFDETGKIVQTLRAISMNHYVQSNKTLLTTPIIESTSKQNQIWDTTAVEGTLLGDDEIILHGKVSIRDRERTMQLQTEIVHYFPNRSEALTDVAVVLRKLNDTTRAIGMRADLNRNRVELLHQVESIHVQP
ncbi:MAG TPA: LPS export ABC transporter periplasmic protein LptC [Spongiibacteraceae bacterium]|nr:LPS export ABC transporter periplasmic protein LptC [Spongiibacteraceae bacterium]